MNAETRGVSAVTHLGLQYVVSRNSPLHPRSLCRCALPWKPSVYRMSPEWMKLRPSGSSKSTWAAPGQ